MHETSVRIGRGEGYEENRTDFVSQTNIGNYELLFNLPLDILR